MWTTAENFIHIKQNLNLGKFQENSYRCAPIFLNYFTFTPKLQKVEPIVEAMARIDKVKSGLQLMYGKHRRLIEHDKQTDSLNRLGVIIVHIFHISCCVCIFVQIALKRKSEIYIFGFNLVCCTKGVKLQLFFFVSVYKQTN